MNRLIRLFRSTTGTKAIVAVTGLVMLGFLVGHVAGNLKVFVPDVEGQPDIDRYAEFLRSIGEPMVPKNGVLWIARGTLLVSLVLHVVCVIRLALISKAARPQGYAKSRVTSATLSARWMMWTGCGVLAFVVFHLLHLTVGVIDAESFTHGKVYANLHSAFHFLPFVLLYLVAMAVIAFHLYHGAWSMFQTLGFDNPDRNRGLRMLAIGISVALFLGFSAVPLGFMTGILKAPAQNSAAEISVEEPNLTANQVVEAP